MWPPLLETPGRARAAANCHRPPFAASRGGGQAGGQARAAPGSGPRSDGLGEALPEAREQPAERLPAGQHAVHRAHQRVAERAGREQLLPQQCGADSMAPGYIQTKFQTNARTRVFWKCVHILRSKGYICRI